MKQLISMALSLILLLSSLPSTSADMIIQISINGKQLQYDQLPIISKGTTLVPMRVIFEALHADVEWISTTKTVQAVKGTTFIKLTLNKSKALVNEQEIQLSQPAKIINGVTMVPLRFVAEALGADVKFDNAIKLIMITSPGSKQTSDALSDAEAGNTDQISNLLIDASDTAVRDQLLMSALSSESMKSIKFLLQKGAKPTQEQLVYHMHRKNTEIIRLFLGNGLDPHTILNYWSDSSPTTLLSSSLLTYTIDNKAFHANPEFTELLLEYGAKPSPKDLNVAVAQSWGSTVQKMIDAGADPNSYVKSGWTHKDTETQLFTAFIWVIDHGDRALEVIKILIENGGKPDPEQARQAASMGLTDTLRIMLDNGYDPNNSGEIEYSLLHYAQNHPDTYKLLIDYGATP